jgi:hypothetical protein
MPEAGKDELGSFHRRFDLAMGFQDIGLCHSARNWTLRARIQKSAPRMLPLLYQIAASGVTGKGKTTKISCLSMQLLLASCVTLRYG